MAKKKAASKSVSSYLKIPAKFQPDTGAQIAEQGKGFMNTELKKVSDRWLKQTTDRDSADLKFRYMQGKDVKAIEEDPERFGDDALSLLDMVHQIGVGEMRQYSMVVSKFSEKDIDEFIAHNKKIAEVNSTAGKLSWSHLAEMARIARAATVFKVLDRIVKENLSVRATRAYVDTLLKTGQDNGTLNQSQVRPATIGKKLVRSLDEILKVSEDLLGTEIIGRVSSVTANDIARCKKTYESARDLLAELSASISQMENRMELMLDEINTHMVNVESEDAGKLTKSKKKVLKKKATKKASKKKAAKKKVTKKVTKKKATKKASKKKATKKASKKKS